MADDPFSCFGSDEEEEDDKDQPQQQQRVEEIKYPHEQQKQQQQQQQDNYSLNNNDNNKSRLYRDESSCGVLSFHANTEQSLLIHVRNALSSHFNRQDDDDTDNCKDDRDEKEKEAAAETVLRTIDNYCNTRHWMMHVGPEKGAIISSTIQQLVMDQHKRRPLVCVELGTYCGYASILFSLALQRQQRVNRKINPSRYHNHLNANIDESSSFHWYTIEINEAYANVARELIRLARMDDCVSVCNIDLKLDGTTENVANVIRAAMASQRVNHKDTHANANGEALPKIDFLFIDHDKDSYLPDLQILERAGMVRSGTTVVADNVIFAKIRDYMSYVKHLSEHC